MKTSQYIDDLKSKITDMEKKLDSASTKAASFDAIAKAVGAELAAQPMKLATLVAVASDRQRELVDEIVKEERLNGTVGDSDDDVNEAKALYSDWPHSKLKRWHEKVTGANTAASAQVQGGDPNSTGADPDGLKNPGKQVDDKGLPSVLANPAITGVPKL